MSEIMHIIYQRLLLFYFSISFNVSAWRPYIAYIAWTSYNYKVYNYVSIECSHTNANNSEIENFSATERLIFLWTIIYNLISLSKAEDTYIKHNLVLFKLLCWPLGKCTLKLSYYGCVPLHVHAISVIQCFINKQ